MRALCKIIFFLVGSILLYSCDKPNNSILVEELPPIYPDYTDINIPYNIAPLNFLLRNNPDKMVVHITGNDVDISCKGKDYIQFSTSKWKDMLTQNKGKTVSIEIQAKIEDKWIQYRPFNWHIAEEAIDPYITYRLIEPGYEVWNKIQLCERNIESFKKRVISDYNLVENSCMNCHITGANNPDFSFFHLRGKNGGTILNTNGTLRKINIKKSSEESNPTYGNLHPQGRYGVFSTNDVRNDFPTFLSDKFEVFDNTSDLLVIDFENNHTIKSPLVSGKTNLETFPDFSADGKRIYFCLAPALSVPDSLSFLKYSLCSIDFDAERGEFGTKIDTLLYCGINGPSISFPRSSPDGKYILYSVSDYGTFPIWHRETRLEMLDLQTSQVDSLPALQSEYSNTYHSWSSNSRWFVFASKRDDGLYGKPYFAYVDPEGKVHKPFVLPQKDPRFYDNNLKSFNIPELLTGKLPFNAMDVEDIYWNGIVELME